MNKFLFAGIKHLQDTLTGGTCFHIVSLHNGPVNRKAVALEIILANLMFIDLSLVPGIVFAVHFSNKPEKY